jgi:hypothetical protein
MFISNLGIAPGMQKAQFGNSAAFFYGFLYLI